MYCISIHIVGVNNDDRHGFVVLTLSSDLIRYFTTNKITNFVQQQLQQEQQLQQQEQEHCTTS